MLTAILQMLREHGPQSAGRLAVHFQTDLAAMDGMLETLERKGRVQRLEARCSRCKGCAGGCPEEAVVFRVV